MSDAGTEPPRYTRPDGCATFRNVKRLLSLVFISILLAPLAPAQATGGTTYSIVRSLGATLIPTHTDLGTCGGGDQGSSKCSMTVPFPVQVYGSSYSTLWVGGDGELGVGGYGAQYDGTTGAGGCVPILHSGAYHDPDAPTLLALWDTGITYDVSTALVGTSPSRRFVVEWRGTDRSGALVDFEMVLHEDSSTITTIYGSVPPVIYAAVGIEAGWNGPVTEYACYLGPEGIRGPRIPANLTAGTKVNYVPTPVTDTTSPAVTSPTYHFVLGSSLVNDGVLVQIAWGATDPDDAIVEYDVWNIAYEGGFEYQWGRTTAKGFTTSNPGDFAFGVRGIDSHGNVGPLMWGSANGTKVREETPGSWWNGGLSYSAGWKTDPMAGASDGAVEFTKAAGASATFTFTGDHVAWYGTRGPGYGSARVYVDGVLRPVVDCHASSKHKATLLFRYGFSTFGEHTVRIVNLATSGHPRIDVDAFATLEGYYG